ncbi:MAG: hypothetical protein R6W73_08330 [Candidatus Saliniplasma sp.]
MESEINMMKTSKKRYLVFLIAALLIIGIAFSGCTEDDENGDDEDGEDGEDGLTGTETYSGDWSGSIPDNDEASGTWEFTVDFDEGTIDGWFKGDGSGDITGTVSDGVVEASGDAAFGTVEWSGDFTSDGSEVSGDWELVDYEGSGTWIGEKGEADGDENGDDLFELTINTDGEGTVYVDPDQNEYEEGTDVALTANPDDGWEFNEWTGDASGTDNPTTITMDKNKIITASFDEISTSETYWNAYDFESEVEVQEEAVQSFLAANDEENKTLQEWTYDHTFLDEEGYKNFTIETTYQGISQTEITVMRYDVSDPMNPEESEETVTIQTYELEHNISVDIQGDDQHPDWINMWVHIPVDEFSTGDIDSPDYVDVPGTSNFWIYSLVEFTDANNNEGLFSYHLTEEWEDEMEGNDDIYYVPYVEGDFEDTDYDEWVLYGIYGHCWSWFQPFSEDTPIVEGTHSVQGFSFYIENTTVNLGGYTFDGFKIGSNDITFGDEGAHLEGTFVPSLPIPVYLQAGENGGDLSYTMELTDIVLG